MSREQYKTQELAHATQPVQASQYPELREYRLELAVLEGPSAGQRTVVEMPRVTIGSGPQCDVQLSDCWVSKVHCTISALDGKYLLRDAGSRNGTFVAGVRIVEGAIRPGTIIELGASRLLFSSTEFQDTLEVSPMQSFGELEGSSKAMRAVFALLERIAPTELTCLIQGETGTGKELCARALHDHSDRRDAPFVVIDCGAIGENLIADKLFGHERGAFTGADSRSLGAFEEAKGGTVFLDEIGELPARLQPKLLRVLERREIVRLGSHKAVPIDVRLLAATHKNLRQLVDEGEFRQDLFFRLSEAVVTLPALRERADDIELLTRTILQRESRCPPPLSSEALLYLTAQDWPGNVRELRNLMRRAVSLPPAAGPIGAGTLADLHEPMTLTRKALPPLGPSPPHGVHAANPADSAALVGVELSIADATEAYRAAYVRELAGRYGEDHEALARHMDVHLKYARRLLKRYEERAQPRSSNGRRALREMPSEAPPAL